MDAVTIHGTNVSTTYILWDNETSDKGDNISPILSLEYFILAVMIAATSIIGTIGNIPVLIVYFRRKENMASNTFIKVLACLDLMVCTMVMPYTIVYELHLVGSDPACRTFEYLRHFAISASNITLVAIAVERYIAVCQISKKLSVSSINCGMWIIIVASAVIASPAVGTFAVVEGSEVNDIKCSYPHQAISGHFCHFTFSIMGKTLVTVYQGLLFVLFFVTFLSIVVLYTLIYSMLWKKTKIKRQMVSKESASGMEIRLSIANSCYTDVSKQTDNVKDVNSYSKTQECLKSFEDPSDIQDDISSSSERRSDQKSHVKFNASETKNDKTLVKANGTRSHRARRKSKFSTLSVKSEKERRKRHYHRRTAKMLFLCTVIYVTTWLPFWFDIFGLTNSLILRYTFFLGNATNPIVYGIVNEQVRRAFKRLFFECVRKWCGFINSDDDRDDTINTSDIRSR